MSEFETILLEMAALSEANDEKDWADSFRNMILLSQAGKPEEAMDRMRRTFAGMGSLNDLILQPRGVPSGDNNCFNSLRSALYRVVTETVR